MLAGNPLVKWLDADPSKEIAVQFERGGASRITRRISDPPGADDFAALTVSDRDFEDLKNCKLGDCVLKLDEDGLQTLRAEVDWRQAHRLAARRRCSTWPT